LFIRPGDGSGCDAEIAGELADSLQAFARRNATREDISNELPVDLL
jgi:hypothetical protein